MNNGTPISDFSYMPRTALSELKERLGLSLTPFQLQICQQYYLLEARRAPLKEELLFLDKALCHLQNNPDFCLVSEFITKDKRMADTYASLMQLRSEKQPAAGRPASLSELACLFSAPSAAAENVPSLRAGAKSVLSLLMSKKEVQTIPGGLAVGKQITSSFVSRETPSAFDRVYALLPEFNDEEMYSQNIASLIASESFRLQIKQAFPVSSSGLLTSLFAYEKGLDIDLTSFKENNPFNVFHGVILIADPARVADFLLEAESKHFRTVCLGTLRKDVNFSVTFPGGEMYSFSRGFITALLYSHAYRVEILPEDNFKADVAPGISADIKIDNQTLLCYSHTVNASFSQVVSAALQEMAHCEAEGVAYSDIRLVADCPICLDTVVPTQLGQIMAVILGICYVTQKLSLHSPLITLTPGHSENGPVSLHAAAFVSAPLPRILGNGTAIYYLSPLCDSCGIPKFDDLKKMFSYVEALRRDGILLSATGISGSLHECLEKVKGNRIVSYLSKEDLKATPGSMLVETKCHIQGQAIAEVFARPTPPLAEKAQESNEDY